MKINKKKIENYIVDLYQTKHLLKSVDLVGLLNVLNSNKDYEKFIINFFADYNIPFKYWLEDYKVEKRYEDIKKIVTKQPRVLESIKKENANLYKTLVADLKLKKDQSAELI